MSQNSPEVHNHNDDENHDNNDHHQHRHDHEARLEQRPTSQDTKGYQRTLLFSFVIITGYMFIEAIGGWLTGSLALLSDAGHMLSDAIALGATLIAFKIGEKAATHQKTFGYKRFEILVATFNGATLVIIALMIFYEAIKRFNSPPEIATQGMLIIATIGMLINILVAWLMHRGGHGEASHGHGHESNDANITDAIDTKITDTKITDTKITDTKITDTKITDTKITDTKAKPADHKKPVNLNMQSAYLHVLSDLLGSVAAIIAALLMMGFGWVWADATASIIVALLILISGYRVVRDSVHILMEGTPANISLVDVEQKLLAHPQVQKVHDLHVWSITSGLNALSCHVAVDGEMSIHESSILIASLETNLSTLGIHHATIQVESSSHPQNSSHSEALVCDISGRSPTGNSHIGHNH